MVQPVSKPNVSSDEEEYRKKTFPDVSQIKTKAVQCTACGGSVRELVAKGKPITHPYMETLLCEKCCRFYGDGEFSVDEDGSDKYCRWCGQGGTLFLCSTCTAGFCKKCVKRNLPRSALQEIEKDEWVCYCCNCAPLYSLRAQCWAAIQYAKQLKKGKEKNKKSKDKDNTKRRRDDSSDSEDDVSSSKKMKKDEKQSKSGDGRKDKDKEKERQEESGDEDTTENRSKLRKRDRSSQADLEEEDGGEGKPRSRGKKERDSQVEKEDEVEEEVERKEGRGSARSLRMRVRDSRVEVEASGNISPRRLKAVVNKFTDLIRDTASVTKEVNRKVLQCHAKRVNMKYLNSAQSVIDFHKKIDEMLSKVEETVFKLRANMKEYLKDWMAAVEEETGKKDKGIGEVAEEDTKERSEEDGNVAKENGIGTCSEEGPMEVEEPLVESEAKKKDLEGAEAKEIMLKDEDLSPEDEDEGKDTMVETEASTEMKTKENGTPELPNNNHKDEEKEEGAEEMEENLDETAVVTTDTEEDCRKNVDESITDVDEIRKDVDEIGKDTNVDGCKMETEDDCRKDVDESRNDMDGCKKDVNECRNDTDVEMDGCRKDKDFVSSQPDGIIVDGEQLS